MYLKIKRNSDKRFVWRSGSLESDRRDGGDSAMARGPESEFRESVRLIFCCFAAAALIHSPIAARKT